MAYTSAFTGAQMDAVFRRVTNTVVGRVSVTAGSGYTATANVDIPGFTDPYCIGTVRYNDEGAPLTKPISVLLIYDAQYEKLMIKLTCENMKSGFTYEVDYMLIEREV